MNGSGVGTVITLNSTGDEPFLFTIDYLQQKLYWINSVDDYSNSCNYSKYIETSHTDGSGRRRIVYNASISTLVGNCTNNSYDNSHLQAIDFFGGAVYTYYSGGILQAVVVDTQTTLTYDSVKWYMCNSTNYTELKVISPKRQLQGNINYRPARHGLMSNYTLQVQTLVWSTMVAVLIFVFLVLTIQETTHVHVTMGHNCIKMDKIALVNKCYTLCN